MEEMETRSFTGMTLPEVAVELGLPPDSSARQVRYAAMRQEDLDPSLYERAVRPSRETRAIRGHKQSRVGYNMGDGRYFSIGLSPTGGDYTLNYVNENLYRGAMRRGWPEDPTARTIRFNTVEELLTMLVRAQQGVGWVDEDMVPYFAEAVQDWQELRTRPTSTASRRDISKERRRLRKLYREGQG